MQSLTRAFDVLQVVAESQDGATQATIVTSTGLNRTTVWRLVSSLCSMGILQPGAVANYTLGPRVIALGDIARGQMLVNADVVPVLRRLRDETGETCHFAVPEREGLVYMHKVESVRPVRAASQVGGHLELHCTALGKAFLAFAEKSAREDLIGRLVLVARTPHTIDRQSSFEAELLQVRARGWALDNQENELEIRCIAAPVLDRTGCSVGAVSVSVPISRLPLAQVSGLAKKVVRAGEQLSRLFGGAA